MVISVPSTRGSLVSSGIGWPLASTPFDQFSGTKGLDSTFFPLVRSRTKKYPLRAACASSLRGLPSISASRRTGVSVLSQSCVSWGDAWKYQTILPVSGFRATIEQVQRLAPFLPCPATTGLGLPVPQYNRLRSLS